MTDEVLPPVRSVLRHLDPDALAEATRQESRARQRHLPPVSVYRWWARRTETVTGAVVDAVAADRPGQLVVADIFSGGGIIVLAALLRGHRAYAQDVNPWAARSLATMLTLPSPDRIGAAGDRLRDAVGGVLAAAYATTFADGTPAEIANTLRVATAPCPGCNRTLRLYPTALVSLLTRVDCGGDTGYLACPAGHLHLGDATKRTSCPTCRRYVKPAARYTTGRVARCVECGWKGKLADLAGADGFTWEIVLVERVGAGRREITLPTASELAAADPSRWAPRRVLPAIEAGVETAVLLRHGMRRWHDLYPVRQRAVIEALLERYEHAAAGDDVVGRALNAAVIGATEMAGFASRWDARYLKAYEAIANHRFNFTTLAAEPNVWGAGETGRGTVSRRLDHMAKAALWLEEHIGRPLNVDGPVPSQGFRTAMASALDVRVVAGSSERITVPAGTLDAIVTDPPYHDDVHYAELSDLFRAWAGEATGALGGDAIVRTLQGDTGTSAYEALLTTVFTEARRGLRPDGHLVLSYANRHPAAWVALFNALQAAGFEAAGFTVVHSENEVDHAKSGRRACILDVLLDLVPATARPVSKYRPKKKVSGDEAEFCHLVGKWALNVGELIPGWDARFVEQLSATAFLS